MLPIEAIVVAIIVCAAVDKSCRSLIALLRFFSARHDFFHPRHFFFPSRSTHIIQFSFRFLSTFLFFLSPSFRLCVRSLARVCVCVCLSVCLDIYRIMLSDKKYGLSVNIMATRVMPSLLPQTVNPSLNLEQFTILLETLQEMLDHIDRQQRNKLKLDNLSIPSPERHRTLRHQFSSDNMHVPPFNIPNLRIDQRKTSSAEDMARKNSTGIWIMKAIFFKNV